MHIEFDIHKRSARPHAVLVFPVFDDSVVFVQHPRRGWEVPGGKVESGESPEAAAHRETFEESGVYLENLSWTAEYDTPDGKPKWIYVAEVVDVTARPTMSETTAVMVPRPVWSPAVARVREDVSFIMKDDVYVMMWPILIERMRATGNTTLRTE